MENKVALTLPDELKAALPDDIDPAQCEVAPCYRLKRYHRLQQTTVVPARFPKGALAAITGWMAGWSGCCYNEGTLTRASTAEEAATQLFEQEDLSNEHGTVRLQVDVWRQVYALDIDGNLAELMMDEEACVFTRELPPPECEDGHEHDWHAPHDIVGGLEENPGVFGNGGGVIINEVCRHCGLRKITDTWKHDDIMDEHYTAVSYQPAPDDE